MPNTKVTITFANGDTREFIASDELEEMIQDGDMFSVTTLGPNEDLQVSQSLSKMYVGNPVAALGHMMMMRRNGEGLDVGDPNKDTIIDILTACINLLSNEITSHQSGMTKANGEDLVQLGKLEVVK